MKKLLPVALPALLLSACASVDPEPTVCLPVPEVLCPVCPQARACPVTPVEPRPRRPTEPTAQVITVKTAGELQLPVVGAVEWASIEPGPMRMEARIDTGAESTSIHAENIQLLERDGKRYVRFDLLDPATGKPVQVEHRFRRRVLIKQAGGEVERRYVVRMWVTLGATRARVDVNLTDRDNFEYPLLIGRNFLTDNMIVDVSQHHVLGK